MLVNKNTSYLTLSDYSRLASDEYRRSYNPFGNKAGAESTGDCNTCNYLKGMGNKAAGKRVPGGFGKCTKPGGPCANPVTKSGIGGAASRYKK